MQSTDLQTFAFATVRSLGHNPLTMNCAIKSLFLTAVLSAPLSVQAGVVRVYPAPAGEELSKDYRVQVEGQEVPVYAAKVAPAIPRGGGKPWMTKRTQPTTSSWRRSPFRHAGRRDGDGDVPGSHSGKVLPSSLKLTPVVQGRPAFRSADPSP